MTNCVAQVVEAIGTLHLKFTHCISQITRKQLIKLGTKCGAFFCMMGEYGTFSFNLYLNDFSLLMHYIFSIIMLFSLLFVFVLLLVFLLSVSMKCNSCIVLMIWCISELAYVVKSVA